MKIDRIEVITLLHEYAHGFEYAGGTCTKRLTSLILVHTDTGHVGVGSVYSHPGLIHLIVRDQLEPLLRGEDPRNVEALWDKMYCLTRWYGRKGAAVSALGGVDIALWDLRGKADNTPIYRLLGGDRSACPAYASALLWNEIDALTDEAHHHLANGFTRMKMRLARTEDYDIEAVRAVRAAIGASCDLMVDGTMRYPPDTARRMAKFFEQQEVFWFEEPFAPEDLDAYVALRGATGVPIAAGENEFGAQGFRELIRVGAVDIVQPDASRAGGISETLRVARLAESHGLRVATHTWSDAVAVIANAHVVAAAPNGLTVEVDQTHTPFIDELLVEPIRIVDGQLQLTDSPGLGVELDQQVIDRLRAPDPLNIPDGGYSDVTFGRQNSPRAIPYTDGT